MILSKSDYYVYLAEDEKALHYVRKKFLSLAYIKELFFPNWCWKFQKLLRRFEFSKNCKTTTLIGKIKYFWLMFWFDRLSLKLGFSIPPNVFGPGLAIAHYGTIVVNAKAQVGANCRIHPSSCIGASGGSSEAPKIGDNVYIAPGVMIYGDIKLGNNIAIAANSAVCKSFQEENIMIGGVPAVKIKNIDITTILKHVKAAGAAWEAKKG